MKQAEQKMQAVIEQLKRWRVPATPINYSVCYDYLSKATPKLNEAIKAQHDAGIPVDNFFLEELHRQYTLNQNSLKDNLVDDMEEVIEQLENNNKKSSRCTHKLVKQLDINIAQLKTADKHEVLTVIKNIHQASQTFKQQQQTLIRQLNAVQGQADTLRSELNEIKKGIYLDPLTGLANQKGMSKHLDIWLSEDPNKKVAAIVINVDQFTTVNQNFGPLISNVLITKVAQKINNYVGESGLPVRSAGNEFLILLPEVEKNSATEVAEKIRQGIEKLRFISNKSGIKLPQMTLSIGVSDYSVKTSASSILAKTRAAVGAFHKNLTNQTMITKA